MAKIELQAMVDRARELVRDEQYDEAIALCRHVLKTYPKYTEAYLALAEASLQQEERDQAADLFKRVLSADPQRFIAYVGLGIIHDEENLVDEAIWQFERAFELAPANAEVREALRRLYLQRDGTRQERIKLNRAALGYLYSDGGLYAEAAQEFQEVLARDPDRIDIRLAMAEALWRDGKRREASQVSQDVLNEMPHCLKANLLLGEIWLDSGLEEEGQTLLRRAEAIDPENRVAYALFGEDSPLPPTTISLDEMTEDEVKALVPTQEETTPQQWLAEFTQIAQGEPETLSEPAAELAIDEPIIQDASFDLMEEAKVEIAAAPEMPAEPEPETPEEESPTIAALEQEFGTLPDISMAEISEEERQALQASMPGDDASSEEILAWLEQQRVGQTMPDLTAVLEEETALEEMAEPAEAEPEPASQEAEDESPTIAALEAEFGSLPNISLEALDESELVNLELPNENASAAEIMAWLEQQKGIAPQTAGLFTREQEPEPLIEEDMAPEPEEREEESPTIASLEAEFGSLPDLALGDLGLDQDIAELEASMPPENASPEEIMAWLRERHSTTEAMPELELGLPAAQSTEELSLEAQAEAVYETEQLDPAVEEMMEIEPEAIEEPEPIAEEIAPPAPKLTVIEMETIDMPEPIATIAESEEAVVEKAAEAPELIELEMAKLAVNEPVAEGEPVLAEELEPTPEIAELPAEQEAVAADQAEPLAQEEIAAVELEPEPVVEEPEMVLVDVLAESLAALEMNPADQPARLTLARAYAEQASWDLASEAYGELVRSAPDQLAEVINDLETLTEADTERLALHQTLGDAYMEAGQLEEALAKYNWVLTQL